MEESLSLSSRIRELFGLKEVDMKAYSPLTLAYIGDAAYELVIRTMVVEKGNRQASQLHRLTTSYVKAQAQAAMIGGGACRIQAGAECQVLYQCKECIHSGLPEGDRTGSTDRLPVSLRQGRTGTFSYQRRNQQDLILERAAEGDRRSCSVGTSLMEVYKGTEKGKNV